jgi:hypothetical protein
MKNKLIVGVAVLMLAAGGAVEFARSGKSASTETIQKARAMLKSLPLKVGEWTSTDEEFDAKQLEVAEASAYVYRRYRRKDDVVSVLIFAGHPKAIGAHDPTVCYGGAGYSQRKDPTVQTIATADEKSDKLWAARFEMDNVGASALQVQWGWTIDGSWKASVSPRIDFAREPLLYKIYVSRPIGPRDNDRQDPSADLLNVLLPSVRTVFETTRLN